MNLVWIGAHWHHFMQKIIWFLLGGIVVIAGLGLVPIHQTPTKAAIGKTLANGARFVPESCWFENNGNFPVQCGWLHTAPLNNDPNTVFRLPVIVVRHQGFGHQPDPVMYLAGGPGASAQLDKQSVESRWLPWYEDRAEMKRDLILVDQRGTGLSQPALLCEEYRTLSANVFSNPGTPTENAAQYRAASEQCHARLTQAQLPLTALGTSHSAQDMNDLLALLDYPKANLLGISYGTRLALEIQRHFPERVRSLTLDSLYPPGEHLFRDWPELLDTGLERILHHCETDPRCQLENSSIRDRFNALKAQLRHQPLAIDVSNLQLGALQTLHLNDEILLAILFDAQYASHSLQKLPAFIRHLQEGRVDLARLHIDSYLRRQFDNSFSEPVFWAVECSDNPSVSPHSMNSKLEAFPELRYYLPYDHDTCALWNSGRTPQPLQAATQPLKTPTLILSGEDDPITPSTWANKAATTQFEAETTFLFNFTDIAHSVLDNKACATPLLLHFLQDPSQRPQADCRFDPTG